MSLAWIVRDTAEKYVGDQWPLFDDSARAHANDQGNLRTGLAGNRLRKPCNPV